MQTSLPQSDNGWEFTAAIITKIANDQTAATAWGLIVQSRQTEVRSEPSVRGEGKRGHQEHVECIDDR